MTASIRRKRLLTRLAAAAVSTGAALGQAGGTNVSLVNGAIIVEPGAINSIVLHATGTSTSFEVVSLDPQVSILGDSTFSSGTTGLITIDATATGVGSFSLTVLMDNGDIEIVEEAVEAPEIKCDTVCIDGQSRTGYPG